MTKTPVRLLVNQPVSTRLVNSTGAPQHAIGPQDNFPVTRLPSETRAFADQTAADAQTARFGFDQQQSQLSHGLGLLDQNHAADDLALPLRYPAVFFLGIEAADEFGHDVRDQRLELFVPAILLGIQNTVAVNDPAHVSRLMAAQNVGDLALHWSAHHSFNRVHRRDQKILVRRGQLAQYLTGLLFRTGIERSKRLLSPLRQPQQDLSAIGWGTFPLNQPPLLERPQDAAQIALIQSQLLSEFLRRAIVSMGKLVEEARFGEGKPAVQQSFVQQADLPGVKAIELAHGFDLSITHGHNHESQTVGLFNYLVVYVKELGFGNCPVLADGVAIIILQFAENKGGENSQSAQGKERLVDAVNHFRPAGMKAVGDEQGRGQRRRGHAETDRHLLRRAGDGTGAAGLFLGDVGVSERVHAGVLQRGEEPEDKRLRSEEHTSELQSHSFIS